MVKVLATGVQEGAHKANPEIRVGRVQLSRRAIWIPPKREEGIERVEYHIGLHQLVDVQLSKKFDSTDPSLAKLGPVELHPQSNVLEDTVHHSDNRLLL